MDDIEKGFDQIFNELDELNKAGEARAKQILEGKAVLLGKMAAMAIPVVTRVGLSMVNRAKIDSKGEPYNAEYYPEKMLVLGKTDPAKFRPDDVSKPVADQFCVISENGRFFELMYSSTPVFMDSYLNPLTPQEVLDIYGLEVMYMLYRAMRDYLETNREVLDALGTVIAFVFGSALDSVPAGS